MIQGYLYLDTIDDIEVGTVFHEIPQTVLMMISSIFTVPYSNFPERVMIEYVPYHTIVANPCCMVYNRDKIKIQKDI